MNNAMWTTDPQTGSRFLDRFAGQELLLSGQDVDVQPFRSTLKERFVGPGGSRREAWGIRTYRHALRDSSLEEAGPAAS
jgi:hypothetical protein